MEHLALWGKSTWGFSARQREMDQLAGATLPVPAPPAELCEKLKGPGLFSFVTTPYPNVFLNT